MPPLAEPPYLDASLISELHAAVVNTGLGAMREALFHRIPRPYVASFTHLPAQNAQVLVDLGRLNGDRPLRDGSVPFRQWLRNARDLTKEQDEEAVFQRAIAALDRALAGPLGKEAASVSEALSSWTSDEITALVRQRLGTRAPSEDSLALVQRAADGQWLDLVLAAALSSRFGDAGLVQLGEARGILPSVPAPALERLVRTKKSFQDVAVWRANLARREACVARVEILDDGGQWRPRGTAFLVGPDRVMTNHHVVECLLDNPTGAHERLRFRFDYKRITDGAELTQGRLVKAAATWHEISRRRSPDDGVHAAGREPGDEELDFALLRLSEKVGRQPVGATAESASGDVRGWLEPSVDSAQTGMGQGEDVFLLQHPTGDPLQIASGRFLNVGRLRVRYDADTLSGSSGSPCFDAQLHLVALHQLGDPNFETGHRPEYNQGIPMHQIAACCARNHVTFEPPPAPKR